LMGEGRGGGEIFPLPPGEEINWVPIAGL